MTQSEQPSAPPAPATVVTPAPRPVPASPPSPPDTPPAEAGPLGAPERKSIASSSAGARAIFGDGVNRVLLIVGAALTLIAVVLVILGVSAFSAASSARSDAGSFNRQRRALVGSQHAAQVRHINLLTTGKQVDSAFHQLIQTENAWLDSSNAVTAAINAAVATNNSGDLAGAAAMFNSQVGAALNTERQRIATFHTDVMKLQTSITVLVGANQHA